MRLLILPGIISLFLLTGCTTQDPSVSRALEPPTQSESVALFELARASYAQTLTSYSLRCLDQAGDARPLLIACRSLHVTHQTTLERLRDASDGLHATIGQPGNAACGKLSGARAMLRAGFNDLTAAAPVPVPGIHIANVRAFVESSARGC